MAIVLRYGISHANVSWYAGRGRRFLGVSMQAELYASIQRRAAYSHSPPGSKLTIQQCFVTRKAFIPADPTRGAKLVPQRDQWSQIVGMLCFAQIEMPCTIKPSFFRSSACPPAGSLGYPSPMRAALRCAVLDLSSNGAKSRP